MWSSPSRRYAHDEALRQELGQLPGDELLRRLHELRSEAGAEQRN
jgi:hypothetical protein